MKSWIFLKKKTFFMTIKSAVVTGGLGFIGSHLVERLVSENIHVRVLDNQATGRISNLHTIHKNSLLEIVKADISSDDLNPYFLEVDAVFHLAALADIVPSIQNPLAYYQSNVTGTARVLEASRSAKVKRFVYAASSSCYGIPEVYPTPESAPCQPEYPYALTKYLGEQMVLHWGKIYKMPVVSLRFFNVYGPRSRTTGAYGAVFGVFLAQKLAGKNLTVVGDGTQTRDFTYVTDVADAVFTAAKSDVQNEIFNVGSGEAVSVNQIVELIGGNKVFIPKRPGEPDCTFANISKIKSHLGWEPKVKIDQGVKIMMDRIQDWKDAPVWTPESIHTATKDWFHFLTPSR